jgi:hypothetical protein
MTDKLSKDVEREIAIRSYHDLPDNLEDQVDEEFFNKLSDFLNDNSGGRSWESIIATIKYQLLHTIEISLNEFKKDKTKQFKEKWK